MDTDSDEERERKGRARYAERFLEKLIQIEVPVPRFDKSAAERLVAAAKAAKEEKQAGAANVQCGAP